MTNSSVIVVCAIALGPWKKEINNVTLHEFTGSAGINVDIPENATASDYLQLFISMALVSSRDISKLFLEQDYNRFMGGVDWNDEIVSFYTSARKSYT